MWTKLVALFLLFAIVASDPVKERKCKDGQSYYDGCNWCHCHRGYVECTKKGCWDYDNVTKTSKPYKMLPPPESFWESKLATV